MSGVATPADISGDGSANRRTPRKSRAPRHSGQYLTTPDRNQRTPKGQETYYASDGAAQQSTTDANPSSHGNGNAGNTKRRRGKANRTNEIEPQHGLDAIPMQSTDGTRSPQPPIATPVKPAYAGPGFHASPAASALPMPKFFSKSVPNQAAASGLQAQLDMEDGNSQAPTPEPEKLVDVSTVSETPPQRESSPLDLLFNAHRAEQARKQSNHSPLAPSPLSQRRSSAQPQPYTRSTLSNPSYHSTGNPSYNRDSRPTSAKAMFMMELDSNENVDQDDSDAIPNNTTPFKDRMAAATPESRHMSNSFAPQDDDAYRRAQSQALKKLLMTQPDVENSKGTPPRFDQINHRPSPPGDFSHTPVPPINTAPNPQHESPSGRKQDIRSMENDLRRILRLDL